MKRVSALQRISTVCGVLVVAAIAIPLYQHASLFFEFGDVHAQFEQADVKNSNAHERDKEASLESLTPNEAIARLVKINSSYSRSSFLFAWLAVADKTDLVEMLRNSEDVERNAYRTEIQTATTRKLATLDPDLALRWISDQPRVRRAPILKSLFREWSLMNLDQAVERTKLISGGNRKTALETILSTRNDLATEDVLDIARELGLEEAGLQFISAAETRELLEDPVAAWDFLLSDDLDNESQLDSLKLVAAAWREQEGYDVLLQVARLFPMKDDRFVLSTVIGGAVDNDIEDAFAWLRKVPRLERGELPCALAMVAARTDPELAFREIAAWSDDPIHVQLEKSAANTWAQTDPRALLDKIETIPQSARVGAMEIALIRLAYESPIEAVEYMEATKEFVRSDTHFARTIAKQWSFTDPEAALEWVIAYSAEDKELLDSLSRVVFRNLVRVDLERSLEISRGNIRSTLIRVDDAAEYDVIWELAQLGKIDEAISLLPHIHGQARFFSILKLGELLVKAGDPINAIELGTEIPSLKYPLFGPAWYFNSTLDLWATRNPQQLFQTLPSFTSPVVRSLAARTLIDLQDATPALTDEQVQIAQAFLVEHPITGATLRQELEIRAQKDLISLDQLDEPEEVQDQVTDALEQGTSVATGTNEIGLNSDDRVTAFERSVALYKTLDSTREEDLRGLLEDSGDIEQASDRRYRRVVIASRFASLNPDEALKAAFEFPASDRLPLLEGIYAEWSESDLTSATKAAARLDQRSRLTALRSITAMRDDLGAHELRSVARELRHAGYANDIENNSLLVDLADNPRKAWHYLTHDGLENSTQLDSLIQVAETAVEIEGLDVLFHLYAPFSRVLFVEDILVLDAVVTALVKNDPEVTWKYVQNGSSREPRQSGERTDPTRTSTRSQTERAYMTNVVQELLLKSWSVWDPAFVLERIEQIPRQLQSLACEHALEALVATEPERAVELIQTLKHLGTNRDRVVSRFVRQWSTADPSAALSWVQSERSIEDQSRQDLLMYVLSSLAQQDPKLALEIAGREPNPSQIEQWIIYELALMDVETAIEVLPLVSEEGRYYANAGVAGQLIENGDVDRAVALSRQYEQDSGESVNWFMFFLDWARENPVQLFERLDGLPPKLRFEGAHSLDYYDLPELTQEQKATVQAIYEAGQN